MRKESDRTEFRDQRSRWSGVSGCPCGKEIGVGVTREMRGKDEFRLSDL